MKLDQYIKDTDETQSTFAEKVGVTQGMVSHWITGRAPITAEYVIPICRASHGQVTPFELRPDLYPDPNWIPSMQDEAAA